MGKSHSKGGDWWHNTKVKTIAPVKRGVISVSENDTIQKSLDILHNNHIISAPICTKSGRCVGFWGMDDLLIALLKHSMSPLTLKNRPRSGSIKTDSNPELEHRHKTFTSKTIAECQWEKNFHGISKEASLHDAMLAFATGVPRIAVFDNSEKKGSVKNIISQSCILKYLAEDTSRLGSIENTSAAALGIKWERVIKCTDKMTTIEVIEVMHDRGVTDLPIVDSNTDKFLAHLSLSDFKTIHEEKDMGGLVEPVINFVKKVRDSQNKATDWALKVKESATMKDFVKLLSENHLHSLYIVDDSDHPKALVSLTNVCHKVFHNR